MAGNTIEAKFIADQLMEQGIPAIADKIDINLYWSGTFKVLGVLGILVIVLAVILQLSFVVGR